MEKEKTEIVWVRKSHGERKYTARDMEIKRRDRGEIHG